MLRLETPRLRIRSFCADDAWRLYDLDHEPLVMRFIGPFALESADAYRERIDTVYAPYVRRDDGLGLWAVEEKATGDFLGWICLRPALDYRFAAAAGFHSNDAELGYRFHTAAWGKGYATEGSQALIDDVLPRRSEIRAVVATALEANLASTRVMQKCGLKLAARFQLPGFDVWSVRYELPRDDFVAHVS